MHPTHRLRARAAALAAAALVAAVTPTPTGAIEFPCSLGPRVVQLPNPALLADDLRPLAVSADGSAILAETLGLYFVYRADEGFGFPSPIDQAVLDGLTGGQPGAVVELRAISRDAEFVAGHVYDATGSSRAFRLETATGRVAMLPPPPNPDGVARAFVVSMSADGSAIAGYGVAAAANHGCSHVSDSDGLTEQAWLWTAGATATLGQVSGAPALVPTDALAELPGQAVAGLVSAGIMLRGPFTRRDHLGRVQTFVTPKVSGDGTAVAGRISEAVFGTVTWSDEDEIGLCLSGANAPPRPRRECRPQEESECSPGVRCDPNNALTCLEVASLLQAGRARGGALSGLGAPPLGASLQVFASNLSGINYAVVGRADVTDASWDGSVLVGIADFDDGSFAFRYEDDRGFERLWPVAVQPQNRYSVFVSADGDLVVGHGDAFTYAWDRVNGTRQLHRFLDEELDIRPSPLGVIAGMGSIPDGGGIIVSPTTEGGITVVRLPACLDSDEDNLCDSWEWRQGIDVDGDGTLDLQLPGANPYQKDIYVEVDKLAGAALFDAALRDVEQAFAVVPNALIGNPNGSAGIRLHLIDGGDDVLIPGGGDTWSAVPASGCGMTPDIVPLRAQYFGTPAERARGPAVIAAKARFVRYLVFGGRMFTPDGFIGGIAEPFGNNLFVTMRGLAGGIDSSREWQAGTIMHELGHTLGLRHGGPDHTNYKPNYPSVMNYTWQLKGDSNLPGVARALFERSWLLDYSRRRLRDLDEMDLIEPLGIDGNPSRFTLAGPPEPCLGGTRICSRLVPMAGPIDWNRNGVFDAGTVRVDAGDVGLDLVNVPDEILESQNDWEVVSQGLCPNYFHPNWKPGADGATNVSCQDWGGAAPQLWNMTLAEIDALHTRPLTLDCDANGVDDQDDLLAGALDGDGDGLLDRCEPLEGDVDRDGDVDLFDRDLLAQLFGTGEGDPAFRYAADLDGDLSVTLVDYQLWIAAFEAYQPPPVGPTSLTPSSSCGLLGIEPLAALWLWSAGHRVRRRREDLSC